MESSTSIRQRLWRWHFFAALFVFPFLLLLSITGSIYLFKPQIDTWEENRIHADLALPVSGNSFRASPGQEAIKPLSLDLLLAKVQEEYSDMKLRRVVLAKPKDVTVEFELLPASNTTEHREALTVWVDQFSGSIVTTKPTNKRFLQRVKKLHSEILLGSKASYLVELAASWCVILIVTGFYLWLTGRKRRAGSARGIKSEKRFSILRLRQFHAGFGVVLALPILVLLFTGLPWTQLWGSGFKSVKEYFAWDGPGQEWFVTLQSKSLKNQRDEAEALFHSESLWEISDEEQTRYVAVPVNLKAISISNIAKKVSLEDLHHPVHILPPKSEKGVWTVRSMPQQRANRVTVHYDQYSGEELMRIDFDDHHPVQRVVSHGISLHEGALFGVVNQVLVLITAMGAIAVACLGVVAWWRRRPKGRLAAPQSVHAPMPAGLIITCVILGVFLPAAGISFVILYLADSVFSLLYPKLATEME